MIRSELETYPLTPMQEGMLFHSLSAPGTGVEIEQIVCVSPEELDAARMSEAWARVARRHEALRTRFRWADSTGPLQEIAPEPVHRFEVAPPGPEEAELIAADRAEDFDLTRSCMRVRVRKSAASGMWMLWSFHHAILDGRSFPKVLGDLFDCYESLGRGEAWEPSAPAGRFADFARHVATLDHDGSRAFWQDRLSAREGGGEPLVEPGRTQPTGDFGAAEVRLSADSARALATFAAAEGTSATALLQVAWSVTLHNHRRAFDVVIGGTRACRHVAVPGADAMVGLLINTVPVRLDLRHATVRAAVRAARRQWLEMRPHELTPLTSIRRWAGSAEPLFDTLVVYEERELRDEFRGRGGAWSDRDFTYRGRTGYPLTLIGYGGERPLLRLEYDRAHIDEDRAVRLLDETAHALCAMPARPDIPPAHLPVQPREQRDRLLALARPRIAAAAVGTDTIVDRLDALAAARPEARAVRARDVNLTRAQLREASERVAAALFERGVRRGDRVGVMADRGGAAVATMLGVMRAGACYVPLDVDLPPDRVSFIAADADLALVIVSGSEATPIGIEVVAPEVLLTTADAAGREGRPETPEPGDAAYVIYTSGSTGTPKGVVVTHANVTALLDGCARRFRFEEEDVWNCSHSFAFDFSVWELWCALMTGASTVIATRDEVRSPAAFADLIARERVTLLSQTPSAFRVLRDELLGRPRSDLALRYIVLGGEALDPTTLEPWFDALGDGHPEVINMYGITETTVHVTHRRVRREDARRTRSPIGEPLDHLGLLLLNAGGGLAPAGAPAVVHVTGAGVAAGYLARPELTAQRFTHSSLAGGARCYDSGDVARIDADGELVYLGRADAQVKVRGHRIEPAEVEMALRSHPSLADVRVIARRSGEGGSDLCAYIVPRAAAPSSVELREHVMRSLPAYMVPRWFVAIDAIQLTRNGKLDYAALPDPDTAPIDAAGFVAPASALEGRIASVWADALGVTRVGTRDNFFDLGGDSLLLVRVAGRLAEALGRPVEVLSLFEFPTVESLSAHLAEPSAAQDRYGDLAARATRQRESFLSARRA